MMNITGSTSGYSTAMMPPMGGRGPDPSQMAEELFSTADADNDGSISKSEFSSLIQQTDDSADSSSIDDLFSQFDTDGDGTISSQENQDAIDNLLSQMRQSMAEGGPGKMGDMPPPPPPSAEDFMANADTDGDSSLNLDEFTAAMQSMGPGGSDNDSSRIEEMFNEADSDGDGNVSEDELKAAMENHRPPPPPEGQVSQTDSNDQVSSLIESLLAQYRSDSETSSTLSTTA